MTVEFKTLKSPACIGGIFGRGHAEVIFGQVLVQQITQPRVVIDHQDMGLISHTAKYNGIFRREGGL